MLLLHVSPDLKRAWLSVRAGIGRTLSALLGREEKLRRHTAMTALAMTMMASCGLVMHVLAVAGEMNLQAVHWWAVFAVSGLLVALVMVRSGFSQRFADPSMTFFQMQWALTCNAASYVIVGPGLRALVLPVLVIIMMFGIFGRKRHETVLLMFYAMALYTFAVFGGAYFDSPKPSLELVVAHFTIVLLSILIGTVMCLQVQSMRVRLRRQKAALELALVQIREMAMRDELTGLINRRQMSELMALELRRRARSRRSLLLAQLDIDHFKTINDQHGHAAGDHALQRFARIAVSELRSEDVLARWGGEEFVLLLCDTAQTDAAALLERLRSSVAQTVFAMGEGEGRMTVSIGWTAHQTGEALEATLARADAALYEAKHQGRNQVVLKTAQPALVAPTSRARAGASPARDRPHDDQDSLAVP